MQLTKSQARRLRAFLQSHWDADMAAAVKGVSIKGLKALAKGADTTSGSNAARKLEELVLPIAEQAAPAIGIHRDDAVNALAGLIVDSALKRVSRLRRRTRKADPYAEDFMEEDTIPGEEDFLEEDGEEDFLEEDELEEDFLEEDEEDFLEEDELEEDFLEDDEEDLAEMYGEDYIEEDDLLDDALLMDEEDFLEEGDLFPGDEYMEEDDLIGDEDFMEGYEELGDPRGALLSARRKSARRSARRKAAALLANGRKAAARRKAQRLATRKAANTQSIVRKEVKRLMGNLPARRGMSATKSGVPSVNINYNREAEPESLSHFIKAVKTRNTPLLAKYDRRTKSSYKALGINPDTSGGYLVPPQYADEIIELLRAQSLFMSKPDSAGSVESLVTMMPMNRDTLIVPRQTGSSTAYWVGENAQITDSQPTLGQIQLTAKKLAALVKVSNELLDDATPDVDAFIRDDLVRTLADKFDSTVLYGTGGAGEPIGIYYMPDVTKTALNAAPGIDDLVSAVTRVEEQNVRMDETSQWILHPRDKNAFRLLQDTAGQFVFAGVGLNAAVGVVPDTLLGYRWATSTAVAKAGSPAETDVFFGHWRDLVVGMRKTIEIVASDVAGTSFEYDQTWIRAIIRADFAVRHPESIEVLTDVREVTVA
ncbi:MAG: phage major capsid protein [Anaerolineae bacterium]|nr:phage major capsid protein [Anaerolineae bacterium]